MSENKHDYAVGARWVDVYDADGIEHTIPIVYAKCACGYKLDQYEIERRLNEWEELQKYKRACEVLSKEDARRISDAESSRLLPFKDTQMLYDYSRILRGEDET
jgi:hypothetical protein